jgi:uncharacterized SAM-binding protein YcdF (DUF218 family)
LELPDLVFWGRKLLGTLLLPPLGPLLVLALGLRLASRRFRRTGFALAWAAWSLLLVLSIPWVSAALALAVGGVGEPVADRDLARGEAIVVLGGGTRGPAAEYGGGRAPTLLTLERVRYGATLARRTGLPLLVTGGGWAGDEPEGALMARMLADDYGLPARWTETRARNTYENARFSAELLKPAGVTRVVLIVHGVDARRSAREFRAAGLEVIVAPTVIPSLAIDSPWDFIPSMSALSGSYLALYELLGNVAMTLAGREG